MMNHSVDACKKEGGGERELTSLFVFTISTLED